MNLEIKAGRKALEIVRDEGLTAERVRIVAGAAGGPKWLVLSGLDRVLFGHFFKNRKKSLFLIGASIGAWRFAALSTKDPVSAIENFRQDYINQKYFTKPSIEDVTRESFKVLDSFLDDYAVNEILSHPSHRLNFLSVRSKSVFKSDSRSILLPGLGLAALMNIISRKSLGMFFERALFYDDRDIPPYFEMDNFPIQKVKLNRDNFRNALMSSGSIPLVMEGIKDIPGAFKGIYRDGAMIDYHLDIPFNCADDLVLYPHFSNEIVPGWFDKSLFWRKPNPVNIDNVLLISPSVEFVKSLPYGKIPDRNDFYIFKDKDHERINYWEKVTEMNERLGDEFHEICESGSIKEAVKPL